MFNRMYTKNLLSYFNLYKLCFEIFYNLSYNPSIPL